MHGPINVKSPNNISKCHMGFNSAFKGLRYYSTVFCEIALLVLHLVNLHSFYADVIDGKNMKIESWFGLK
jgi:hypothetical protein